MKITSIFNCCFKEPKIMPYQPTIQPGSPDFPPIVMSPKYQQELVDMTRVQEKLIKERVMRLALSPASVEIEE